MKPRKHRRKKLQSKLSAEKSGGSIRQSCKGDMPRGVSLFLFQILKWNSKIQAVGRVLLLCGVSSRCNPDNSYGNSKERPLPVWQR